MTGFACPAPIYHSIPHLFLFDNPLVRDSITLVPQAVAAGFLLSLRYKKLVRGPFFIKIIRGRKKDVFPNCNNGTDLFIFFRSWRNYFKFQRITNGFYFFPMRIRRFIFDPDSMSPQRQRNNLAFTFVSGRFL